MQYLTLGLFALQVLFIFSLVIQQSIIYEVLFLFLFSLSVSAYFFILGAINFGIFVLLLFNAGVIALLLIATTFLPEKKMEYDKNLILAFIPLFIILFFVNPSNVKYSVSIAEIISIGVIALFSSWAIINAYKKI